MTDHLQTQPSSWTCECGHENTAFASACYGGCGRDRWQNRTVLGTESPHSERISEEHANTTWLATGIGERIAHHLQVTALLREQGKTKEAAELDERFNARLAWEMS